MTMASTLPLVTQTCGSGVELNGAAARAAAGAATKAATQQTPTETDSDSDVLTWSPLTGRRSLSRSSPSH